jgi:hypothetical protein
MSHAEYTIEKKTNSVQLRTPVGIRDSFMVDIKSGSYDHKLFDFFMVITNRRELGQFYDSHKNVAVTNINDLIFLW